MQFNKFLTISFIFLISTISLNATCICNSTVTQEFKKITKKKDTYYKNLNKSIDKLKDQIKNLNKQQRKELPAVQAALNNYLLNNENEFKKTNLVENSNQALSILIEQLLLRIKTILPGIDQELISQIENEKKQINNKIKLEKNNYDRR